MKATTTRSNRLARQNQLPEDKRNNINYKLYIKKKLIRFNEAIKKKKIKTLIELITKIIIT